MKRESFSPTWTGEPPEADPPFDDEDVEPMFDDDDYMTIDDVPWPSYL